MSGLSLGGAGKWRWPAAIALALAFAGPAQGAGATAAVVVPKLNGGVVAAYQRLHARGLRVSIPGGLSFDSTSLPSVWRSMPNPGRRVSAGSIVTLYLSRGRHQSVAAAPGRRYHVPSFVGGAVSRAYAWARARRLGLLAHLGPLRAASGPGLLANYRVTAQRFLTVWGVQPQPRPLPPPPPPPPPVPPDAQTGPATVAGPTAATLTGAANPEGRAASYRFSYGPTGGYGSETESAPLGAGNASVTASSAVSGLAPATTYHYRLVATSSAGTTYGADQTFTTVGYYQNSVFPAAAFPDPFVLDNASTHADYWAFATGDLFPILHSTDLVNWTPEGTAMAARPTWVLGTGDWHPWAPSVLPCPGAGAGGCFVMYYVGLSATRNVNCIGVATATAPGGPYTDQGPLDLASPGAAPLGCGDDTSKGNIDPSPFIDSDGRAYLYVSSDFACTAGTCTLQPTISVIPLSPDLLHAAGPRTALFSGAAGTWEQGGLATPTVEGPWVTLHNGTYYLFYSGGNWRGAYGMGYATAASPTGPFTKAAANPILAEGSSVLGPGGGDQLITGPHGGLWLAYAARSGSYDQPRTLRIDPFNWEPGDPDVPVIHGPSSAPQPLEP